MIQRDKNYGKIKIFIKDLIGKILIIYCERADTIENTK